MNSTRAVDALNRACEHWNAQDLEGYLALYRHDAVLHGYAGVEPGFEGIRAFDRAFWSAFPATRLVVEDVLASGERLACRFVAHGRHLGNFQGLAPTGKAFALPGNTILSFAGDKCVERWSQADVLSLLQQIGGMPGAAA